MHLLLRGDREREGERRGEVESRTGGEVQIRNIELRGSEAEIVCLRLVLSPMIWTLSV